MLLYFEKLVNKKSHLDIKSEKSLKKSLLKSKQPLAVDILDEIKELASIEHISTESEIDILDEINMNATVKPLHKSTSQDKNKTFKKFIKH